MDPNSKGALTEILRASHELVGAVLVISHDDVFLQKVASRIVRIDQ